MRIQYTLLFLISSALYSMDESPNRSPSYEQVCSSASKIKLYAEKSTQTEIGFDIQDLKALVNPKSIDQETCAFVKKQLQKCKDKSDLEAMSFFEKAMGVQAVIIKSNDNIINSVWSRLVNLKLMHHSRFKDFSGNTDESYRVVDHVYKALVSEGIFKERQNLYLKQYNSGEYFYQT